MRRILLKLCRQLVSEPDRTTASAAAIVLAKQRLQDKKRTRRIRLGSRGSTQSRHTGATAAEFIVVLPLLIVLCLTSVDFGRFAHAYIALGNAGRTAAEYGATHAYSPSTANAWKLRVEDAARQDFAAIADIDPAELDIQIDVADDAYGLYRATLTTTYPFQTIVAWPAIPRPLDMQRTIVFRRFR
jgi:Flp pilus assembly protein TadG